MTEFMRESTVFCSTCTISSLKSSLSLSHLLMSLLFNNTIDNIVEVHAPKYCAAYMYTEINGVTRN